MCLAALGPAASEPSCLVAALSFSRAYLVGPLTHEKKQKGNLVCHEVYSVLEAICFS